MNKEHIGTVGIIGLAAYVAAWDLSAPETITHAFKRYHVAARVGIVAVTGAHLLGLIPREYDPFYWTIDHTPLGDLQIDKGETYVD